MNYKLHIRMMGRRSSIAVCRLDVRFLDICDTVHKQCRPQPTALHFV